MVPLKTIQPCPNPQNLCHLFLGKKGSFQIKLGSWEEAIIIIDYMVSLQIQWKVFLQETEREEAM